MGRAKIGMTEQKYTAAILVAQDRLTNREIGKRIGVTARTIETWKNQPEFQEEITRHLNTWRERIMERGVASKERRLFRLNDRWRRCQTVIDERSRAEEMQKVAGGKTGLLCHTVKSIGSGADAQVVDEYEVDVGLLKEIREIEAQAAQELGQWDRVNRAPSAPVVLVVASGVAPQPVAAAAPTMALLQAPQPAAPARMPGVVIDLAPEGR